ncbi:MAG: multicopper oxidase domain-containing protein, partial [Actinomycetota bacterium]
RAAVPRDSAPGSRSPVRPTGEREPGAESRGTAARGGVRYLALAGTDGWATMPSSALVGATKGIADTMYFPDPLAEWPNRTTYVFSFRNVTGLDREVVAAQKGRTQVCAPLFYSTVGEELWVTLTNLGLQLRPDLVDSHTLHWHGFRNAIPFYDGVPESSISVPIGRDFTYVYRPKDAGTYMYHCHFEDVEHVTMGMQGIVFVKPDPNDQLGLAGDKVKATRTSHPQKAYGLTDGDLNGETAYDREYAVLLGEIDARAHFNDAHIQTTDWTDFHADFWTFNGRAYPDTLEPNSIRTDQGDLQAQRVDGWKSLSGKTYPNLVPVTDTEGPAGRLSSQPLSSVVYGTAGERILIRFANLGFLNHSIVFPGLDIDVLGRDARFGPKVSRRTKTDTIQIGPGESRDVYIDLPVGSNGKTFKFYDRGMSHYTGSADGNDSWVGGQMSEIRVVANLAPQLKPNGWPNEGYWTGERSLAARHKPPTVTLNKPTRSGGRVRLRGTVTVDVADKNGVGVKGLGLANLYWAVGDTQATFPGDAWNSMLFTPDAVVAGTFNYDVRFTGDKGTYWVIAQDTAGVPSNVKSAKV